MIKKIDVKKFDYNNFFKKYIDVISDEVGEQKLLYLINNIKKTKREAELEKIIYFYRREDGKLIKKGDEMVRSLCCRMDEPFKGYDRCNYTIKRPGKSDSDLVFFIYKSLEKKDSFNYKLYFANCYEHKNYYIAIVASDFFDRDYFVKKIRDICFNKDIVLNEVRLKKLLEGNKIAKLLKKKSKKDYGNVYFTQKGFFSLLNKYKLIIKKEDVDDYEKIKDIGSDIVENRKDILYKFYCNKKSREKTIKKMTLVDKMSKSYLKKFDDSSKVKYGFELETLLNFNELYKKLPIDKLEWIYDNFTTHIDGSCNGVEFVTRQKNGKSLLLWTQKINMLYKLLDKYFHNYTNDLTGVHIHIDKNYYNTFYKSFDFINLIAKKGNKIGEKSKEGRKYSKAYKETIRSYNDFSRDRYKTISNTNGYTYEIRSITAKSDLKQNLTLVDNLKTILVSESNITKFTEIANKKKGFTLYKNNLKDYGLCV
ncbi:MAG: hypothetical protein LBC06_01075 [Rickettsiales bacterium]|jgi:hypothetical protein|nr:hypothetical protein [Rickettsiales bacterium]